MKSEAEIIKEIKCIVDKHDAGILDCTYPTEEEQKRAEIVVQTLQWVLEIKDKFKLQDKAWQDAAFVKWKKDRGFY